MKETFNKIKEDTFKAAEVLLSLLVLVAVTRAGIVTWYNDSDITGLPVDRIVAGVLLTLVFSYFVWLHDKKK